MSRPLSILLASILLCLAAEGGEGPAAPKKEPTAHEPMQGLDLPDDAYVGAERCAACHAEAYDKWVASAHARAFRALPPERRADRRCTSCHSPDPGRQLAGVQCESCHGSGRSYSMDFIMKDRALAKVLGLKDPGEGRCRSCHTPEVGSFDYRAKLKAMAHGLR